MKAVLGLLAILLLSAPALAVEPSEILDDPVLEKRARDIGKHLRCVVCQNQAIDESNSDLARDMRVLVRKRLQAGATDDEVIQFMVSRYGDFVLLDPPFKMTTYVLWFAPGGFGVIGIIAIALYYRRRRAEAAAAVAAGGAPEPSAQALNPDEEARVAALLNEDEAQ